jgi:protein ImuB
VLDDPREERRLAESVPLARLDISPKLRDQMALLGVRTLAGFLQLRAGDLLTRYGEEAARLHRDASGDTGIPIAPARPYDAVRVEVEIDPPDDSLPRLVFALKRALRDATALLAARSEAVIAMRLALRQGRAPAREERIETAAPTLDVTRLSDLVSLRLESVRLAAPVESVVIEVESVRVHAQQIALLQIESQCERRPRDIEAANRALARVKAALGSDAVVCARLVKRHLPEASFRWEPVTRVRFPERDRRERARLGDFDPSASGAPAALLTLVRDLYAAPIPLPPIPEHEPEAWLGARGVVERIHGPFRVSGGWWRRRVERDYYFVETQRGEILWVFLDRVRRRWFLHGAVV